MRKIKIFVSSGLFSLCLLTSQNTFGMQDLPSKNSFKAIGKLTEDINLVSMPDTMKFTVIGAESDKSGAWYSCVFHKGKPVGKDDVYNVDVGSQIASTILSTTDVIDTGPGVPAVIKFKVSSKDGKFEKTGYLKSSATDWPIFGRPSNTLLIFGFNNDIPSDVSQAVPTLISPDPYYLNIAVKDEKVFLIAGTEKKLSTSIISMIVDGIFTAHTKALNWVVGAL